MRAFVKEVLYGLLGIVVFIAGAMLLGIVVGCILKFIFGEIRF